MFCSTADFGCAPGLVRATPARCLYGSFGARARATWCSRGVRADAALGFQAGSRGACAVSLAGFARDLRGPATEVKWAVDGIPRGST
eukprot:3084714-Pyramimonas_sp.AAC.1